MTPEPHLVRRGEGTSLLFLHGNGVDHRMLLGLDECLSEPGVWERIYVDLPGYGRTPALPGEGGLPDLADWVDGAVAELFGDSPFAIVASSLGALLARDVAARRPAQVLGMALIAPVVDPVAERRSTPPKTVLRRDPELLASLDPEDASAYEEMAVVQSPEGWRRFEAAALPGIRAADLRAMARLARRYELARAPEKLGPAFTGPVLVVTGRQDHVVGYADQFALLESYPRASYAVLDEAGHNVVLEQGAAVAALLREWSAQTAPG